MTDRKRIYYINQVNRKTYNKSIEKNNAKIQKRIFGIIYIKKDA